MEQWRTVVHNGETYDNYEVSTEGRVRSLNYKRTGQIKVLKQSEIKKGYLQVGLSKNGEVKRFLVHRLVAIAFIPNPHNKPTVNHIDTNPKNNHVENLEWATYEEQNIHDDRQKKQGKSKSKKVKCIDTNTIYDSIKQASQDTGVKESNIVGCCKGQYKQCKGLHFEYLEE